MSATRFWWSFVLCAIVVSGSIRIEARNSNSFEKTQNSMTEPVSDLLRISGATELKEIHLWSRVSGHQFRHPGCEGSVRVIAFSIALVADGFVESIMEELVEEDDTYAFHDDTYAFQYLTYTHHGSSRFQLTTIWALNKLNSTFNLSPYRDSKEQLAILWPDHCDAPAIDWSLAWRKV